MTEGYEILSIRSAEVESCVDYEAGLELAAFLPAITGPEDPQNRSQ